MLSHRMTSVYRHNIYKSIYLQHHMTSGDYTRKELKTLINRQNMLGQQVRTIGGHQYWGTFTNGFANGFGLFEYTNGDYALGYWKRGMMDSEGKPEQACVFYRKNKDAHFFGLFNLDCAVAGRLFRNFNDEKDEGETMKFGKLVKNYDSEFWDEIIPPPPVADIQARRTKAYTLQQMSELNAIKTPYGFRRVGLNQYYGEYANEFANGFGKMEYKNGDVSKGYWKNGKLHSDGEKGKACVYYRKDNDAYFFGMFENDYAVEVGPGPPHRPRSFREFF